MLVGNGVALRCTTAAVEEAVGVDWTTEGVGDGVAARCAATGAIESTERATAFGRCAKTGDVSVGVADTERVAIGAAGVELRDEPNAPSDLSAASAMAAGVSANTAMV